MRIALVVEYDGTKYHGFQLQANALSIQEELEGAISRLTGERPRVKGAGRTDAGVHAKGQVVAFDSARDYPPETFVRGLNFYLPDEISVKAAYRTGSDFNPRRMAVSRRYRYTMDYGPEPSPLTRLTAYHVGDSMSIRRMQGAARFYTGRHDFAGFAGPLKKAGASTFREVYESKVKRDGDAVTFEVEANSFLPHQVRRMAGALVEIGRGRLPVVDFKGMMGGQARNGSAPTLPAHGLCLLKVNYVDFPPKVGGLNGNSH